MPLDQGGFDQHQSKAVIAVTLFCIGRHLLKFVPQIRIVIYIISLTLSRGKRINFFITDRAKHAVPKN